ncbi:hypothetical protein [Sphingomonas sp. PP-CC-3A-396]|uniref:hypothetical protein n=1 Tax=Sphingomonas sp. PP-CC-3A-396 TaxID=2135655 RepID=UPI001051425E|nr:hypothetical protein [Sphingomonas sp. PP-CC-3A-396]TCQ05671.1 hypothetical protein C8J40_106191 [Sphingomonas sp. PP-CC-3A-396]
MMRFFVAAALLMPIAASAVASPPQKDVGEKSADPGAKMICKKFIRTGSLVDGYRICKTKREWERDRDLLRQSTGSSSCKDVSMGQPCG